MCVLASDDTTRRVSFNAWGIKNAYPDNREDLVFPYLNHNLGGAYSATTGRFTAPAAGIYIFLVSLERAPGVENLNAILVKGRGIMRTLMSQAKAAPGRSGEEHSVTTSMQAVLHVRAGQQVWVMARIPWVPCTVAHNRVDGRSRVSFSGALLIAD